MKYLTLLVVFSLFLTKTNAQNISHLYSLPIDYSSSNLVIDSKKNMIIQGNFSGNVDFDSGSGVHILSGGNQSPFLLKLDSSGNFLWALKLPYTPLGHVGLDNGDNIILGGTYYNRSIDLDPSGNQFILTTATNKNNAFITKLDENGNFLWGKNHVIDASDNFFFPIDFKTDPDGNSYFLAMIKGDLTSVYPPAQGNITYQQNQFYTSLYISKIYHNGNNLRSECIGLPSNSNTYAFIEPYSLNISKNNDLLIGGRFVGELILSSGDTLRSQPSLYTIEVFTLKLDQHLNYESILKFERGNHVSNITDVYSSIGDTEGNIYTMSTFYDSTDFDPALNSSAIRTPLNNQSIFIQKLDSNMAFVDVIIIDAAPSPIYQMNIKNFQLSIDQNNRLYLSGSFNQFFQVRQGNTTTTINSNVGDDLFLLEFETNGSLRSANVWGNALNNAFHFAHIDSYSNLYIAGEFENDFSADFPFFSDTVYSTGSSDFLSKYALSNLPVFTEEHKTNNKVNLFPNPFQSEINVEHLSNGKEEIILSLYTASGQLIDRKKTMGHTIKLATPDLLKGIYFLEILTNESKQVKRLVKY